MSRFRDVAAAVAWRSIHRFLTNPQLMVPSLVFPLFFFVAFAGGLSNVANVPGFDFPSGYTAFQFVFVLLQASAFGGVFTGFSIAGDFESGFSRRLMLAAPEPARHPRRLRVRGARARRDRRRAAVRRSRSRPGCRSTAAASTCSACSCSR